jgi:NitT/TauT family transport system substrate-binding protein
VTRVKAMKTVAIVLAVLGVAVGGPPDALALDRASFRLSWLISATAAPFYLGLDKGFYKAEGIDLTIEEGKGAALSAKLVAQKQDTFGMADAGVVINSIEQGMPIKMFWCHYQQNPSSVLFLKQQGIREPKDLIGKKIAGSATASHTLLLKSFLKLTAVDPAKVDVFYTNPPFIPLLLTKKVDAMAGYYFLEAPTIEERSGQEVGALKFADFGLSTLSNGLIVHHDTLKSNPDLVQRFVRATTQAWAYSQQHPGEAIDSMLSRVPKAMNRNTELKILRGLFEILHSKNTVGKPLGWMAPQDWQQTVDVLHDAGEIKVKSQIDKYYTNDHIVAK